MKLFIKTDRLNYMGRHIAQLQLKTKGIIMIRGLVLFFMTAFLVVAFQNCSEAQFASIPDRHYVDESLNSDGLNDGSGEVITDDGAVTDDGGSNSTDNGDGDSVSDTDQNSDGNSTGDEDGGSEPNTDGETVSDTDSNTDTNNEGDSDSSDTPGTVGEDVDGDGVHSSIDDELQYACGNSRKNHKVLICHVPKGNIENRHNICIAKSALKAHIDKHGAEGVFDYYGECID